MSTLLILRHLKVENANAIAGLTWGFPAISAFLGFTHALSRFIEARHDTTLTGCGVISHHHEVKALQPSGFGETQFSLTRNPLTREGKTAPFNEEGKMHMEVSLVIECNIRIKRLNFDLEFREEKKCAFEQEVMKQLLRQRLAGGVIQSVESVDLLQLPEITEEHDRFVRRQMLSLLPGYVLVDRSKLLRTHCQSLREQHPEADMLDAWLDFSALRYRAVTEILPTQTLAPETQIEWEQVSKPDQGWLVPIMTGYRAIAPLLEPGQVAHARDGSVPFCFVESVYGAGQWVSPHRIHNLRQIFWRYHHEDDHYLCINNYETITELAQST